ncbi:MULTISPECIES: hypothetical protein [Oscillatoriales]|jgi:hypothetical protein|uniref:Transposase, IS605 OrfB n=1 Tax=Limnospira platensis NIES-46 TaxID=1236695 RepID=A0A5M3TFT4_LIMPL|nr:hypothetical protein [Arthrospira platensis]MDF2213321.1 hypothetical protein [Arthrospira platensis NCB002]MDT9185531.1 hypothetical protein [Limnospira sp. PMC 289.06]MDT9297714.1 hypothetical protein [Arthrospira platensis PCC 7345]MDT9313165.1 hypothetical protein [Limnospira sp. Paracas R14]QQW27258.1 hypothetical protein AP9108_18425 [Arthrospira sp. PCC 9108]BDT13970.1 hypothetical protein N39L_36930 [Arthrospira platensis NIES-39]
MHCSLIWSPQRLAPFNQYINADCNAAANIIRKVSATLGLNLNGVSRGALTTPLRVRIWTI